MREWHQHCLMSGPFCNIFPVHKRDREDIYKPNLDVWKNESKMEITTTYHLYELNCNPDFDW